MFAADIKRQRISRMRGFHQWRWHVDEVFVKINGERHYLWRAVDHEGEIFESYVTKKRDKSAALRLFKKALKRHRSPAQIVTDGLKSHPAAMLRFRQMKSLHKFASVHANVHNHFNQDRHLTDRKTYKANRSAALVEWQNLIA